LGGGGAGGDSWENLKDGAGHLPHEVGAALWVYHGGATDEHVVAPLQTMGERVVDADLSNLLRQWEDDPEVKNYLVVIGKRVEVLHQLRACHATAGNGQRNLALLGERTMVSTIRPYPLVFKPWLHPRWTILLLCLLAMPRWSSCRLFKPPKVWIFKSWMHGSSWKCIQKLLPSS
jgi:hypothetical protein